ncbi:MAG: hypothetical protein DI596_06090 [Azospira oryzae]|nr:MAG: hypothetical protein DI596_06090 [Azospira oryzae]PZP80579.1 MAG: hypothetical protein DI593_06090 [Azospira oryzae]
MEIFYESENRISGAGFEIRLRGDRWYWSVAKSVRPGSQGVASHLEIAITEVRRCLGETGACAGGNVRRNGLGWNHDTK